MLVGYARCSTEDQDLAAQRARLEELGVEEDRIYIDQGLTGRNRDRPGLEEALAAARAGDTLVVAKLDRLARSVRDARDIADELTAKRVKLSMNGSVYDPVDPVGKLLFTTLSMVVMCSRSFVHLLAARTREGMAIAKAQGRLKGKAPELSSAKEKHLVQLHGAALTLSLSYANCSTSPEAPCTGRSTDNALRPWRAPTPSRSFRMGVRQPALHPGFSPSDPRST